MGFMDELKKLTKPYDDDEDDFFEGADASHKSAPAASPAQLEFEQAFGEEPAYCRSSPRAISTSRLNTLLCLHRWPINEVVFFGPYS